MMTPHFLSQITLLLMAYLLGSIPFGVIISRLFRLEDPRKIGSQSIGATNILRSGHKIAAFLTLFFDTLKGSIAVFLSLTIDPSLTQGVALAVVIGHIFPLWLKFQGGKGVATAFGAIFVLKWPLAIICLTTWLVIAFITRYSSLASLSSVLLSPLYAVILDEAYLMPLCFAFTGLLFWTHRSNIGRLLTGRETKIGKFSPPPPPQDR